MLGDGGQQREFALDQIDRNILAQLQANCRISNLELANAVHLSPSPCLRRHKLLESTGVIHGYTAIIEPSALGFAVAALVEIIFDKTESDPNEFYRRATAYPEVAGCHATAGDIDYLLKVVAKDMNSFSSFVKDKLRAIPGVRSTKANIVIDPQPGIFAFYNYFHPLSPLPISGQSEPRIDRPTSLLDEIDRHIIVALVRDARMTNVELSRQLGVSPSSCLRRLRALENAGTIRAYTAIVDPAALRLSIVAFVGLRLRRGLQSGEDEVRAALANRPEVAAMHETAGNVDFMLRVVARSVDDYGRFVRDCLRKISAIDELYGSFAIDPVPVLFSAYRFKNLRNTQPAH